MSRLTRENLQAFAARDWGRVTALDAQFWSERKRDLGPAGPAEMVRVADELRRQVIEIRPNWPTAEDRDEDISTHARVAWSLAHVAPRRR